MRFNIVIPTHCRCKLLKRTLTSLANAIRPEGFEHVIVIENGSNDGANNICKQFSNELPLIYKHQIQSGKGRALQSVMEELKNGFALFLDDDVRVCSDLLTNYSAAIQQHGAGYIYGGPLLIDYEVEPKKWLIKHLPNSVLGWSPTDQAIPYLKKGFFLGANFGAFVEDILAVGGFLADLGPGSHIEGTEGNPTGLELEIQTRLQEAGGKRYYVQNAKVWHFVSHDRCTPSWALHRSYRNRIYKGYLAGKNKPNAAKCWYGIPKNLWIRYPGYALLALIANFIPVAQYRFKLKRDFYKLRGQIKGYQLARR